MSSGARRVLVTGLGLVSPLGIGHERVWSRLLARESGIVHTRAHAQPRIAALAEYAPLLAPVALDELERARAELRTPHQPSPSWETLPLATRFALVAAAEALNDARLERSTSAEADFRFGVSMGTGIGPLDAVVDLYEAGKRCSAWSIPRIIPNTAAGYIAAAYGFAGPLLCSAAACAAGAQAIGDAVVSIRRNQADCMLAGGTESALLPLTIHGFNRARALSDQGLRPFQKERDGFVMGEGAACLLLEAEDHALRRGARIYGEVKGYGISGDGYHLTSPRDDGLGALVCMQNASSDAEILPGIITYVNAHGTGTPKGDAAEVRALKQYFRDSKRGPIYISSTKGASGHLLGASGAFEAVISLLSVYSDAIPPTICDRPVSEDLFEHPLEHVTTTLASPVSCALSNSFGFGGTNTSLIFSKYH